MTPEELAAAANKLIAGAQEVDAALPASVKTEIQHVIVSPRFSWAAKAARTGLQLLASGAVAGALKYFAGTLIPLSDVPLIAAVLTPAATAAQNLLEDKGVIGRFLSKPPAPPAVLLVPVTIQDPSVTKTAQ